MVEGLGVNWEKFCGAFWGTFCGVRWLEIGDGPQLCDAA